MRGMNTEELLFFDGKQEALPLYLCLRERGLEEITDTEFQVKKTQISLKTRRLYGAVSFLAVRRAKLRPNPYLTVTFGLDHCVAVPRIDAAVEAQPNRWTHHVMIGDPSEIDEELIDWLRQAAAFSAGKR